MRKLFTIIVLLTLVTSLTMAGTAQAQNRMPRQLVIVVSEGLGSQAIDFSTGYVKTAYEEGAAVAFDELKAKAKVLPTGGVSDLRGLLKTAAANGYKTGLVTTGNVAEVAPLFYDLPQANAASTLVRDARFDLLAGGGRADFGPVTKDLTEAGVAAFWDAESLDADVIGKSLILQSDADLTYVLDRDVEKEAGFAEMATLAMQTLSADDAPFVLVVHDTLAKKAIENRDTPALLEQFRELDGIIADALGFAEGSPGEMGIVLLTTSGTLAPRFSSTVPTEQVSAFYILSELPFSYGRAGQVLQGADDAKLTAFATEEYKGWKLTPESRAEILAGTITPEQAIRASYEPVLKIEYAKVDQPAAAYVWGFEAGGDMAQALKNIVSSKPADKLPPVEEDEVATPVPVK